VINKSFIRSLNLCLFAALLGGAVVYFSSSPSDVAEVDVPKEFVPAERRLLSGQELLARLRQGGTTIHFRHFARFRHVAEDSKMHSKQADLTYQDLRDCSWQLALIPAARGRAKFIGDAIRTLGIPVDDVISSPYCRCVESAMLMFNDTPTLDKNLVFPVGNLRQDIAERRLRTLILQRDPDSSANAVLIAHRPQIDRIGKIGAGDAYVFERASEIDFNLIGIIKNQEWREALEDISYFGRTAKESLTGADRAPFEYPPAS